MASCSTGSSSRSRASMASRSRPTAGCSPTRPPTGAYACGTSRSPALSMIASGLLSLVLAVLPQESEPAQEKKEPIKTEKTAVQRGRRFPVHVELARASLDPNTPLVVLYHGSNSSLGEYR